MSVDIRTVRGPDETGQALKVFFRAMVGLPPLPGLDPVELTEAGRYLGAFDDGVLVGGADSYTSWLTVPGGARVPHGAVTHVGVLPTHTRRGVLSALMRRQLRELHERGEIVASLRASEAVIYERFGYGVASSAQTLAVSARGARLRPGVAAGGPVTLVDPAAAPKLLAGIYGAAAWTGAIHRPDGWWYLHGLRDSGGPAPYVVVHGEPGDEDGYVVYRPRDTGRWFGGSDREVVVEDFVAHTAGAYAGLVRHLLSLDLVDVVTFASAPLDDPLPTLVTDQRAVEPGRVRDETWLRLVDVPAALRARAYREAAPVTIEVGDDLLPHNAGRYVVGPAGVHRADGAEPDLVVGVAALAAAYLGGTRWWQLARGGRAVERTAGAIDRADELFATPALPYAGTVF